MVNRCFYPEGEINEIANEIVQLMPSMAQLFSIEDNLPEYSKKINIYNAPLCYIQRQQFFKKKLCEKINSLFNDKERKNIQILFEDNKALCGSVVEHHGILDPGGFLSVPIVSYFYRLFDKGKGDIITFATGNVSLDEPFRKRGIMFHGKKINIYPKADKDKIIYGLHPYKFDIVELLRKNHQWCTYLNDEQEFLNDITEVIAQIDFSTCKYLGEQITKINYYLWPMLFEEEIRKDVANFLSIEYDEIVVEYLIHILENEKTSFIYQMLFNQKLRDRILQEFNGVVGAWDNNKGVGSHFFWGLDKDNRRIRLYFKNDYLVGENNDCEIPFALDSLIYNLRVKKLLPVMFLKFSLIIFYMGMKPLTGGASAQYLFIMRELLSKVLGTDYPEEVNMMSQIPLGNMNLIGLCKGINEKGDILALRAFDIIYAGGFRKEYFDKLSAIPLKDFFIPNLLEAYNYAISKYGETDGTRRFVTTERDLENVMKKYFDCNDFLRISWDCSRLYKTN